MVELKKNQQIYAMKIIKKELLTSDEVINIFSSIIVIWFIVYYVANLC